MQADLKDTLTELRRDLRLNNEIHAAGFSNWGVQGLTATEKNEPQVSPLAPLLDANDINDLLNEHRIESPEEFWIDLTISANKIVRISPYKYIIAFSNIVYGMCKVENKFQVNKLKRFSSQIQNICFDSDKLVVVYNSARYTKIGVFLISGTENDEIMTLAQIARLKLKNGESLKILMSSHEMHLMVFDGTLFRWDFMEIPNAVTSSLEKILENSVGLEESTILDIFRAGSNRFLVVRRYDATCQWFGKEVSWLVTPMERPIMASYFHSNHLYVLTGDFCLKCYNMLMRPNSAEIWSVGIPLLQRVQPNRPNMNEIVAIDIESNRQFILVKWSIQLDNERFRDCLYGILVTDDSPSVPVEIPTLSLFDAALDQPGIDRNTNEYKLLESTFQTSLTMESSIDRVCIVQSNACFLFKVEVIIGSNDLNHSDVVVNPYTLSNEIWAHFDILNDMYFPKKFLQSCQTKKVNLKKISDEFNEIESNIREMKENINQRNIIQVKKRPGLENSLGDPGMRRRIGRVLNETFPTSLNEARLCNEGNPAHGLISARYDRVWEEENLDNEVQRRRLARQKNILNRSNFERTLNGTMNEELNEQTTIIEGAIEDEGVEPDKLAEEIEADIDRSKNKKNKKKKETAKTTTGRNNKASNLDAIVENEVVDTLSDKELAIVSQPQKSSTQICNEPSQILTTQNSASEITTMKTLNYLTSQESNMSQDTPNPDSKELKSYEIMDETILAGEGAANDTFDDTLNRTNRKKSKKKDKQKKKKNRRSLGF